MRKATLFAGGSLVSAIIASLCCIGPAILAIIGAGSLGAFATFGKFRPYFIGLTVILFGLAFYLAYRKRNEMNSCCTQRLEVIAADQHHDSESCCLVTEKTPAPARAKCPVSVTPSRKVLRRTLEHLLRPEMIGGIRDVQYYYCKEPTCKVVYFSNENMPFFSVDDVNARVFVKDQADDVSVCYCFDWTRARIKQQIRETGKSTAAIEIAREIKAGNCACDTKNPKGECCLGDVNAVVKEALLAAKP